MNRPNALLAVALLLLLPQTASAQNPHILGPGATQSTLAAGEVLAQVTATGTVRSKPDLATFRVTVIGQAETYPAARAAADAKARDLAAKLAAAGIDATAIRVLPSGGMARMGFVGNEAYAADGDADGAEAGAAMARQRRGVTILLEVQVTDIARLGPVRAVLEGQDSVAAPAPVFSLRDNSAARRRAIADGIGKARRDADAYAAALGMRVDRVARVYDQAAATSQAQDFAQMINLMNGGGDDQVVTEARVGMEVVLAPK